MGKIKASDKIMFKHQKRENMEIKEILYKAPSKKIVLEWNSQLQTQQVMTSQIGHTHNI